MRARQALAAVLLAAPALAQVPFAAQTSPAPGTFIGDLAVVTAPTSELIVTADRNVGGLYVHTFPLAPPQVFSGTGPLTGTDYRRFQNLGDTIFMAASASGRLIGLQARDGGLRDVTDQALLQLSPTAVALSDRHAGAGNRQPLLFVSSASASVRVIELGLDGGSFGQLVGQSLSPIVFPAVAVDLVADDRLGRLFATVPSLGVYMADQLSGGPVQLVSNAQLDNQSPQGLAFYPFADGGGLLLIAVPSRDLFSAWAVGTSSASRVGTFQVGFDGGAMVRNSAWLDVTPDPMPGFPDGLLVVADPGTPNYKLVAWEAVAQGLGLPVPVRPDGGADAGRPDGGGIIEGGGGGGGPSDPLPRPCGCTAAEPSLIFTAALFAAFALVRSRRARQSP